MSRVARPPLLALRRLVRPEAFLAPEERERVEDERVERNRSYTARLFPPVVAAQLVMLLVYHPRDGDLHAAFRTGVFWIHIAALPFNLGLLAAVWIAPRRGLRLAWLGDAILLAGVGLGVALSLNTHRLLPNINALTIALFAGALVVRPTLPGMLVAYGGSLAAMIAGVRSVQPDADIRVAYLATGISAFAIAVLLSRVLDASFIRDVVQRLTIARQQDELRAWNAELERRVAAQVEETLAHANEARALDAQLRWKVRDRSRELARALRSAARIEGELRPGDRFEQRFDIEHPLGAGAMGKVYSARDRASGQPVALKLLRRWEGMSPADLERFVAEAEAAATVVHPAIVRTYHVDVTETGCFYLVMELVQGRTLASELAHGTFDAGQAARLGAVVAEALASAHAAGVVHRDVKPANLMLTSAAPGVRVLDFGISKLMDAESAAATMAGQVVGTPQYMAPEQILGGAQVTGATDVYALGQVLYEMLAGEPCFGGRTVADVLRAQIGDAPLSLRARTDMDLVPADLSGLIALCLEKDPRKRPPADAVAASLRVIADSLSAARLEDIGPPRHPRARPLPHDLDPAAPTIRAS